MDVAAVGWKFTYTVLGCVVLGLEGAEQRLLGTENLDGGTGRLGEVHEGASVGDQARTDELTNKRSQVGCKCLHAGGEVVAEVLAVPVTGLAYYFLGLPSAARTR
jgi:hypothetical protein